METLESVLETLKIGESRFINFVERHKPRCFRCIQKGQVRAECATPKENNVESPEPEAAEEKPKDANEEKPKEQT